MIKKIVKNKYFYFCIIFLFMFVFNCLTHHMMDDYQLMYDYTETKRITSFFQVINELYHMYFNWGGRMLAHFFAYSFLALPKWVFNIANSIVYVLNVYLIYLIAKGEKEGHPAYLLVIHMLLFVFFPVVGQVFFWLDGSCNYSFTLLFELLFIYLIINIKEVSIKKYFFYFLISLLAGMCNENSSLSLIAFIILYIIWSRDYLKLKVVSLFGLIIGYLFMFLAPGNYVRMETVSGKVSFFYHIFDKLGCLIITFWPILFAVLVFVIIFAIKCKDKRKLCITFYLSSLVSFFAMLASPQLSIRSFTLTAIYVFIILLMIFFYICNDKIKKILIGVLCGLFIFVLIPTSIEYCNYYEFMKERDATIMKAKSEGKESVAVEIYDIAEDSRIPVSSDFYDLEEDCEDFPNRYLGVYYGIKIYGYHR